MDTSGVGHKGDKKFRPDYKEILKYTDLVLLDVKHTRSEMYKEITCVDMSFFMEFLDTLNSSDTGCLDKSCNLSPE